MSASTGRASAAGTLPNDPDQSRRLRTRRSSETTTPHWNGERFDGHTRGDPVVQTRRPREGTPVTSWPSLLAKIRTLTSHRHTTRGRHPEAIYLASGMTTTLDPRRLRTLLLEHYDAHRRDLPWRESQEPYRVWVSEIMLQQTRVETVIPYYRRWMERFPTVEALADGDEETVLKAWEGLGYYSRARNLRGSALIVRERLGGVASAGLSESQEASWDRRVQRGRHREHRLRGGGARRGWERAACPVPTLRPGGPHGREPAEASQRARRSGSSRRLEPGPHGAGSHDLHSPGPPLRGMSVDRRLRGPGRGYAGAEAQVDTPAA